MANKATAPSPISAATPVSPAPLLRSARWPTTTRTVMLLRLPTVSRIPALLSDRPASTPAATANAASAIAPVVANPAPRASSSKRPVGMAAPLLAFLDAPGIESWWRGMSSSTSSATAAPAA